MEKNSFHNSEIYNKFFRFFVPSEYHVIFRNVKSFAWTQRFQSIESLRLCETFHAFHVSENYMINTLKRICQPDSLHMQGVSDYAIHSWHIPKILK